MILPGAMLGVLGGGQLGRMLCVAARTMGYRIAVLDPDPKGPAANFADVHVCAPYDDEAALSRMARICAAVTTEFENVPAQSLDFLAQYCPVRPGAAAVAVCQDRIREKCFLRDNGIPTAPFVPVRSCTDLEAGVRALPLPALLKTARSGYDGKGQRWIYDVAQAAEVCGELGEREAVLETRVAFARELSLVIARGIDGQCAFYPLAENHHRTGILDVSIVPASVSTAVAQQAAAVAQTIAQRLDYCGVLAVEFFLLQDDTLLVNEIAPRPHNSGHYTIDACVTSQFEQHVRAICGLAPGDPRQHSPAVMVNLLGDAWSAGEPAWSDILGLPAVKLHLYGKAEARTGRKMGHITCLAADLDQAMMSAQAVKRILGHRVS